MQRKHHLIRGVIPTSLASLDSGHATQYTTSSSNNTLQGRRGPLRATMRPKGVPQHLQSTLSSVSSERTSNVSTMHRSPQYHSLTSSSHPSLKSETQEQGVFSNRRAHSVEALLDLKVDSIDQGKENGYFDHGGQPHPPPSPQHWKDKQQLDTIKDKENPRSNAIRDKENPRSNAIRDKENPYSHKTTISSDRQSHHRSIKPFQDITNKQKVAESSHPTSKISQVEKKQPGSVKEQVSPLNAARLRPIQQETRSAMVSYDFHPSPFIIVVIQVSITPNAKVCLKFLTSHSHHHTFRHSNKSDSEAASSSSTDNISEIIQISTNGMDVSTCLYLILLLHTFYVTCQIELFRPLKLSRTQHNASAEYDGFYLHACYTYHDLPSRYWRKYQYACQFVSLVRSKTPKVTLYTDQAKCMYMENGPEPDYEVCFYNGKGVVIVLLLLLLLLVAILSRSKDSPIIKWNTLYSTQWRNLSTGSWQ